MLTYETRVTPPSTWHSKAAALGPGLLAASAAIGASHLISSTQAGALFGFPKARTVESAHPLPRASS